MLKKTLVGLAAITVVMAASVVAKEISVEKVKCFISGKPAKAESSAAYREGKVFFCCDNCPAAFDAKDEAMATKANHQLVATKQYAQKGCPFSGRPVAEGSELAVAGTKVGFCCDGCKGKVEGKEDDAAKVAIVYNNKSFEKGFAKVKAE